MPPRPLPPRPVVLLVDDEAEIREVLGLHLQPHFDVETAASAEEAEKRMTGRAYDVIVCDHLMPGELGLAFLTRVRTHFPQVQRILMTGYINPELLSRSSGIAGLASCLMKPINASDLIDAIRLSLPLRSGDAQ